tara:strand:- start:2068 stop:3507 length:1440 start_codon:yes stop_codon:yes gene_type:complete
MSDWESVIGLEIHIQLMTKSKIFSSSSTAYGAVPNQQASYVDLGMPGTLPVLNEIVIKKAIEFGLAINGQIAKQSIFARKNYFYPDLPKNYQISQLDLPIVEGGYIEIKNDQNKVKRINILRAHLEEDAGKSIHSRKDDCTFIDLNRAGTPLLEVVSQPELSSAKEAVEYMKKIHEIVTFLKISDGNMQEGSFRCDANVSVKKHNHKELGTRTELKNINSFKFVEKAINFEINRQIELIEEGGKVIQETRLYDENKNITKSMRSKEEANDYRYFPDPDLLPIEIDEEFIKEIKNKMSKLPDEKRVSYKEKYNLTEEQINILLNNSELSNFADATFIKSQVEPKKLMNYIISSIYLKMNKEKLSLQYITITPDDFCKIIGAAEDKKISKGNIKEVIDIVSSTKEPIEKIIEKLSKTQDEDQGNIDILIEKIIRENPKQTDDYKNGKTKILGFFVGQVLKKTDGSDPEMIKNKIIKMLDKV